MAARAVASTMFPVYIYGIRPVGRQKLQVNAYCANQGKYNLPNGAIQSKKSTCFANILAISINAAVVGSPCRYQIQSI